MNQELYGKAKDYALRSLGFREQTELQLRQKLEQREYSEDIIDAVILFLKQYNYLNDERFLEQYIASHCHKMNRRQLHNRLYTLGFRQIDLEHYLEENLYDEEALLAAEFESYVQRRDITDPVVRNKVTAHFLQKGYSYSSVQRQLNHDMNA